MQERKGKVQENHSRRRNKVREGNYPGVIPDSWGMQILIFHLLSLPRFPSEAEFPALWDVLAPSQVPEDSQGIPGCSWIPGSFPGQVSRGLE